VRIAAPAGYDVTDPTRGDISMAGYTVVNLREVEDSAEKFGYAPKLQARFARGALGLEKTGLSLQKLRPGFRGPFAHTHGEQEEIYVIVGGSGRLKVGDEVVDVGQWDAVRVGPGVVRLFEAGDDGLELIAFGAPSAGGMGDTEMVKNDEFWPA
jgi:mannose-6-phosphate isomerase-like protein (cupin superfamily)